jgi:RNA polymerase III RPC4
MAPPPPAQKGKFRPKKPAKKINRPGTALQQHDGSNATASTSGPTVAFDMSATSESAAAAAGSSAYRRNSGGGGGGGRSGPYGIGGGGGGRGRGRAPIPQGRAFFTGAGSNNETVGSTRAGGSSSGGARGASGAAKGSNAKATTKRSAQHGTAAAPIDMSTEEVVGELDTAIGGNAVGFSDQTTTKARSTSKSRNDATQYDTYNDVEMVIPSYQPYTYDSDSSDDDKANLGLDHEDETTNRLQPMQLPFPSSVAPTNTLSKNNNVELPPTSSLFANIQNSDNRLDPSDDSWFLVQLPSRLPPLQKKTDSAARHGPVPDAAPSSGGAATLEGHNYNPLRNLSDVVTQPILTDKFDNELVGAAPGRIGRILVYKSGKTVLEMESQDGEKVNDGIYEAAAAAWCLFHRLARV